MNEAPKFEEDLAALEKLVAELETGGLGLDEALKRFEKGVQLAGQLQKSLEDTGRRLEKLGPDGLTGLAGGQDAGAGDEPGAAEVSRARKGAKAKPGPSPTLF